MANGSIPVKNYRLWVYLGVVVGFFVPLGLGVYLDAEHCSDSTCGAAGIIWILVAAPLFIVGFSMCLYGLWRIGENKSRLKNKNIG